MKFSIPEPDFALAINETIQLVEIEVVMVIPKLHWMNEDPFETPAYAATVGVTDYAAKGSTLEQKSSDAHEYE